MKCVKHTVSGEVRRLSEARANELIEKGIAKFCPKSEWKEKVRDAKKETPA